MKKFTLFLVTLMAATMVSAKQTIVFKGETLTGNWASNQTLTASLFADLQAGDVIWVQTDNDEAGASSASQEWYQLSISIPMDPWTDIVNSYDVRYRKYWSHTVTADEATNIKAHGINCYGHFIKVKAVGYGSAYTSTEIQYWGTSDWTTANVNNIVLPSGWGSASMNNASLSGAHIGDRITVTFTHEDGIGEWDAQLQICLNPNNGDPWQQLIAVPVGQMTSITLFIDDSNITDITTGDIRLNGNNLTVTSMVLETTDLYYGLNAANSLVDLAALNGKTVNVSLTRKIDWNTTICLPFDVADPYTAFGHEGAFYSLKEYNSGLVFTPANTLEAGKPYYATFNMTGIAEEDKTMTFNFDNMTINTTLTNSDEVSGLTFKGNYTPSMDMAGKYGVACKDYGESADPRWVWGFYKGGTNAKLNAYSAYIEGAVTEARLSIIIDDETTGIDATLVNSEKANSEVFNLQGRKVAQPTKGLYIMNGKKVIVK